MSKEIIEALFNDLYNEKAATNFRKKFAEELAKSCKPAEFIKILFNYQNKLGQTFFHLLIIKNAPLMAIHDLVREYYQYHSTTPLPFLHNGQNETFIDVLFTPEITQQKLIIIAALVSVDIFNNEIDLNFIKNQVSSWSEVNRNRFKLCCQRAGVPFLKNGKLSKQKILQLLNDDSKLKSNNFSSTDKANSTSSFRIPPDGGSTFLNQINHNSADDSLLIFIEPEYINNNLPTFNCNQQSLPHESKSSENAKIKPIAAGVKEHIEFYERSFKMAIQETHDYTRAIIDHPLAIEYFLNPKNRKFKYNHLVDWIYENLIFTARKLEGLLIFLSTKKIELTMEQKENFITKIIQKSDAISIKDKTNSWYYFSVVIFLLKNCDFWNKKDEEFLQYFLALSPFNSLRILNNFVINSRTFNDKISPARMAQVIEKAINEKSTSITINEELSFNESNLLLSENNEILFHSEINNNHNAAAYFNVHELHDQTNIHAGHEHFYNLPMNNNNPPNSMLHIANRTISNHTRESTSTSMSINKRTYPETRTDFFKKAQKTSIFSVPYDSKNPLVISHKNNAPNEVPKTTNPLLSFTQNNPENATNKFDDSHSLISSTNNLGPHYQENMLLSVQQVGETANNIPSQTIYSYSVASPTFFSDKFSLTSPISPGATGVTSIETGLKNSANDLWNSLFEEEPLFSAGNLDPFTP